MISKSRRDSAGGGVVAELFFRDLQEPTWFSGGGGSGRIVSVISSYCEI